MAPLLGISGLVVHALAQLQVRADVQLATPAFAGLLIVSLGDRVIDRSLPFDLEDQAVMAVALLAALALAAVIWWWDRPRS